MLKRRSLTKDHFGLSSLSGVLLCMTALGFGASRDFGAFLLSLAVLPLFALATLILIVVELTIRQRAAAGVGAALLVGSVPFYLASATLHDRVRFAGWALTHPSLLRKPGPSRIVDTWDGWGMAGSENDSYLVVDKQRRLGSPAGNERWRRSINAGCPIVDVHRMWSSFYIVTTYNCPLEAIVL